MKHANLVLLLALLAVTAGVGCSKNPKPLTFIPGQEPKISQNDDPSKSINADPRLRNTPLNPQDDPRNRSLTDADAEARKARIGERFEGGQENREVLAAQTIYFDFDRYSIKPNERAKLDAVGAYLKNNQSATLKIEGHCDERGTEEYNRVLGERRAIAARDYLVQSQGVDSTRVTTVSFGEDKPADAGHDESAFAKNRRAEFVVLGTGTP
jgi:peptidoglycan-associated lipoprotein